ncbi:MAG: class I SAM-dependent methyltransferase [Bryobacteraceae bacterium]
MEPGVNKHELLANSIGLRLEHAQSRYFNILSALVKPGCRWLEVGCGGQLVPDWSTPLHTQSELASRPSLLVGIDVDSAIKHHPLLHHRVFALGDHIPFAADSFDIVSANMVVEHIEFPAKVFSEIHRVLAPGGIFLFHTPNHRNPVLLLASLIPYSVKKKLVVRFFEDARDEEDVFPTFYRANTTTAIRNAARASALAVEDVRVVGSVGFFNQLGALGYLEMFILKLHTLPLLRALDTNIIAVLKKA